MIRLTVSPADLRRAAEILNAGGIAAFPTETVYGLGARAFDAGALARVFEAKGRPRFDPLIIHIDRAEALDRVAETAALAPARRRLLENLIQAFWPGPLTVVLPKRPEVPLLATAGLLTVAVRLPAHPAARELIRLSGGALAAPSANPFGRLSPTRAEHVIDTLGDKIDAVVDGGPSAVGVESTVVDLSGLSPRILRPGGAGREALEAAAGEPFGFGFAGPAPDLPGPGFGSGSGLHSGSGPRSGPAPSPGMLKSHYAPLVPLVLHTPAEMAALSPEGDAGYLFFSGRNRDEWLARNKAEDSPDRIMALSEEGAAVEAAAGLFERLHRLDRRGFLRRIHAETLPEEGLGAAVNDRLRRAAASTDDANAHE